MSEVIGMENDDVQYICSELDSSNQFGDLILEDGTRAVIVNGNLLTIDGETLILQETEDLNQYCTNESKDEILMSHDPLGGLNGENDEVQFVNTSESGHQVVYIRDDEVVFQSNEVANSNDMDSSIPLKMLKVDNSFGEIMDLEQFLKAQGIESDGSTGFQYAIVSDSELHNQENTTDCVSMLDESSQISSHNALLKNVNTQDTVNLSKIRGRNLLTGQPITLSKYMDKIQARITNDKISNLNRTKKPAVNQSLKSLLNKKFTLGKSADGKVIVGKVVNIKKREEHNKNVTKRVAQQSVKYLTCNEVINVDDDDVVINNVEKPNIAANFMVTSDHQYNNLAPGVDAEMNENNNLSVKNENIANQAITNTHAVLKETSQILVHEKVVTKECFENISRILSGLMNMDSVKKKLLNRNIIVKVVEKFPNRENQISYSSGYMVQEYRLSHDQKETIETSRFVPDPNTRQVIFENSLESQTSYELKANVTITIKENESGKKITKVNLNPSNDYKCKICGKAFVSTLLLKLHMKVHLPIDFKCDVCLANFPSAEDLDKHKTLHDKLHGCSEEGMFECVECNKKFTSSFKLRKHMNMHFKPIVCLRCNLSCSNVEQLKKHLATHKGNLQYCCRVCGRKFSRQSNLQRHIEIHKGDGAKFSCNICSCSYHYMSSLTRHIVQNHVKKLDTNQQTAETLDENFHTTQNVMEIPIIEVNNDEEECTATEVMQVNFEDMLQI